MLIEAALLTLGKEPEPELKDSGLMVKLSLAENHNRNVGTQDNPQWERVGTSWYNFVAFGDVAEQILDELDVGDAIRLLKGRHRKKKLETDDGDKIVDQYTIYEYEKYD